MCLTLTFSLTAALAFPQAPKSPSSSVLQQHYERAQKLQTEGSLDEAARQYRIFIADALGEMALQRLRLRDYQQAAPLFDEALRLAPNSPTLEIEYAFGALAAGETGRARTLAETVLRKYPTNIKASSKARLIMGRYFLGVGKKEAARQQFEAAVATEPNFDNGYALGVACLELADEVCAGRVFAEMVAGLGDSASLHLAFGRAYLNSDSQAQSIPEFRKAIAEDDRLPGAHYALAVALLTSGTERGQQAAEAELQQELRYHPDNAQALAQLGNIHRESGRDEEAESELKRSLDLDPGNPEAPLYLGELYKETKRPAPAIAALRLSIANTKDVSHNRFQVRKAHYILGHLMIDAGQPNEGAAEIKISEALLKESLNVDRVRLANYLEDADARRSTNSQGDPLSPVPVPAPPVASETPGEQDFRAFKARLAPAIADSYNNLGADAATAQNYSGAIVAFERAAQWNPSLEGLEANWGRATFLAARFADAIPLLSRHLNKHPGDNGTRSMLGISCFMTKDYVGTVRTLETMDSQLTSTPQLAFIYADALVKANRYEEGLKRLLAIERLDVKTLSGSALHQALADAYTRASQPQEAAREKQLAAAALN